MSSRTPAEQLQVKESGTPGASQHQRQASRRLKENLQERTKDGGEGSRAGHKTGWGVSEEHREEAREGGALWQRGRTEDGAKDIRDRWVHFFLRSSKDDK